MVSAADGVHARPAFHEATLDIAVGKKQVSPIHISMAIATRTDVVMVGMQIASPGPTSTTRPPTVNVHEPSSP